MRWLAFLLAFAGAALAEDINVTPQTGPAFLPPNGYINYSSTTAGTAFPLVVGGVAAGVDLDFVNNRGFNSTYAAPATFLTVTRTMVTATGYMDDSTGNWTAVTDNTARISNKGLLVEEARTNFFPRTLDLRNGQSCAGPNTCALSTDFTSPIPGADVIKSTLNAFGGDTNIAATTITGANVPSTTYTFSFFLYVPSSNNFSSLQVTNEAAAPWVGPGPWVASVDLSKRDQWVRVQGTLTSAGSGSAGAIPVFRAVAPSNGGVIYTSGWQMEVGAFATSPIGTTGGSTGARGAEIVTLTTPPSLTNPNSMYAESGSQSNEVVFVLDDNSLANEELLYIPSAAHQYMNTASVNTLDVAIDVPDLRNTIFKVAAAYAAGDQAGTANGAAVTTSAVAGVPTVNHLRIGGRSSGGQQVNSYVRRFILWNGTRVSNANLQALTK